MAYINTKQQDGNRMRPQDEEAHLRDFTGLGGSTAGPLPGCPEPCSEEERRRLRIPSTCCRHRRATHVNFKCLRIGSRVQLEGHHLRSTASGSHVISSDCSCDVCPYDMSIYSSLGVLNAAKPPSGVVVSCPFSSFDLGAI